MKKVKKENAKKKRDKILETLPYMMISILCGMLFGGLMVFSEEKLSIHMEVNTGFVWIVQFLLASYIQLIIHEAGHLVFGILSGYQFTSFRIGSFMWVRIGKKIKFKRYSLMGTGGQCLLNPPELVDGKFPVKLYNAGGVLMNLISSVIFGLFVLQTQGMPLLCRSFIMLAFTGVMFALINGIPMHAGGVDNDGYNILHLEKSPDAMRSFWIQVRMNAENANGKRLKDMPEEWFAIPEKEKLNNPLSGALAVFACNRAMDQKDFQKASTLSEYLLNETTGILPIHKSFLVNEYLYCEIVDQNRADIIEQWKNRDFKKFEKGMKNNPSVIRTQYAYELLHCRNELKAEEKLKQFEKIAKTYPYEAEIQSERELISYVQMIDQKRQNL